MISFSPFGNVTSVMMSYILSNILFYPFFFFLKLKPHCLDRLEFCLAWDFVSLVEAAVVSSHFSLLCCIWKIVSLTCPSTPGTYNVSFPYRMLRFEGQECNTYVSFRIEHFKIFYYLNCLIVGLCVNYHILKMNWEDVG